MALTLKATDAYIASARLDFLYSNSPVKEWKDLPYYGKATTDSAGGYSGYGKVAYSFRQPKKGGHWTAAAKIIADKIASKVTLLGNVDKIIKNITKRCYLSFQCFNRLNFKYKLEKSFLKRGKNKMCFSGLVFNMGE